MSAATYSIGAVSMPICWITARVRPGMDLTRVDLHGHTAPDASDVVVIV